MNLFLNENCWGSVSCPLVIEADADGPPHWHYFIISCSRNFMIPGIYKI